MLGDRAGLPAALAEMREVAPVYERRPEGTSQLQLRRARSQRERSCRDRTRMCSFITACSRRIRSSAAAWLRKSAASDGTQLLEPASGPNDVPDRGLRLEDLDAVAR
jgi:hypothetical protein